jgi:hypothetical protein
LPSETILTNAIAMNSCCSTLVIFAFFIGAGDVARAQSTIFVMHVDGSNVEKISHSDDRYIGGLAWSHDGKRLVYMGAGSQKELYVETLGESKPTHLGSGAAPCWSPDDQQIAFFQEERNAAGAKPGVWIMNSDGGGREWIRAAFEKVILTPSLVPQALSPIPIDVLGVVCHHCPGWACRRLPGTCTRQATPLFRSKKGRFILPCTGWSGAAGSSRTGGPRE